MMKKAVKIFIVLSAIVGTATTVRAEGDKGLIGITTSMYTNEGLTILCDTLKDAVELLDHFGEKDLAILALSKMRILTRFSRQKMWKISLIRVQN